MFLNDIICDLHRCNTAMKGYTVVINEVSTFFTEFVVFFRHLVPFFTGTSEGLAIFIANLGGSVKMVGPKSGGPRVAMKMAISCVT